MASRIHTVYKPPGMPTGRDRINALVVVQVGIEVGADLQGPGVVDESDDVATNRRLVNPGRHEAPPGGTVGVVATNRQPLTA